MAPPTTVGAYGERPYSEADQAAVDQAGAGLDYSIPKDSPNNPPASSKAPTLRDSSVSQTVALAESKLEPTELFWV